jgi:hypothetical protein
MLKKIFNYFFNLKNILIVNLAEEIDFLYDREYY